MTSVTTPRGETTTIKRDEHDNAETVERPVPGETTQATKYKYTVHGQLESAEDPLKHVSKYEYDAYGDRTSEVNPSGDKTVREYDEDSREVATTTPRGELPGADAAIYTTQIERDAQGRPIKWQHCNSASESGATGLLLGDQTSTYSVADTTSAGYEEAFQFTAGWSGTVEELQFRTNGVANTGVTGLVLAVFADSSGKPGEVLGSGTVSGTPATNSWIKASGLSVEVTTGTKYWLVALPLGSGSIHYNAAASFSAGTRNDESTTGGLGSATAESSWATYNQGPVGFQANGTTTPPAGASTGLLTGDQTSSYSVADVTSAGHEEAFQFTAGWSGTVEELQFRTNGVANTGITGLVLAVFADSSGKPGEVLGSGTVSGTPATNSWIKASGLSIAVTAGTKYWLVALPLGSGAIHYNAAASFTVGTRNDESTTGGLTTATAESSWETYDQGPVGFQANGTTKAPTYSCTNVSGSYVYDADGNLAELTDANKHTTKYTYNADNQPVKVKQANGDTTETEYDGEGYVTAQTDGNKHTTKYTRNILGQVTEAEDPLKHKTKKEYDAAGNLTKVSDAAERTTTYKYDTASRLTAVEYSEEATPDVKYDYDADGNRTKMEDGTGTSKYTYDTLDRLTESKDGHGNIVKYEYDLANRATKTTYPNGKAVLREYDSDGRLKKVEDWLEHATTFSYDPNSNLKKTVFPNNEDKYTYNQADQQTRTEIKKGAETLATLAYTPDNLGQLEKVTQTGLPGAEETKYTYDENNRLTKDGANEYKYDAADNPTTTPGSTNSFNEASELTTGTTVEYTYNTLGERTKRTPSAGPATTYSYDQAGNLTKVDRPEEGETAKIKDSYAYDGNGLRASQTIGATATYMTWDPAEDLPLLLTDGTNSYIYGPDGTPVEQINNEEAVHYLHPDRQGSTRLITGSAGTVAGKCTYTPYGTATCEGATTTPLGYDGQYRSSDTGLIYLRARTYDPATAQFLSVDPLEVMSRQRYTYTASNPLNEIDSSGLWSWNPISDVEEAAGDVGHFVATNKVAVGIGLGVVAVGTGGAGLVAVGAFEATSAGAALGTAAIVSGGTAAVLDAGACARAPGLNGACIAAGLGGLGALAAAPELAVTFGLVAEPPFQEFAAAGIGGYFLGGTALLADVGQAIYDELVGQPGACISS